MKTKRKTNKYKNSKNKTKKKYRKKSLYEIYKQLILNYKKD
jgi:hypothetical protein